MQEEKVNFSLLHPLSPTPQGLLTVGTNFKTTESGCKENHFYSLPFGQAEASIY